MKEFKHRTDLLNEECICFKYGLTSAEFDYLRKNGGFPEPEYYRRFRSPEKFSSIKTVVYWRPSVVKAFMEAKLGQRCASG